MTHPSLLAAILERKSLLIFDLDGTIADTGPLHEKAFKEVFAPWAIEVDYAAIAGMATETAVTRVLDGAGVKVSSAEIARLVREKRVVARRLIERELSFVSGADAFIRCVRRKYRLAVCSSGSTGTVQLTIAKLGLKDAFDMLVTAEDVVAHKPEPDGFLLVMRTLGLAPEQTLVFEDSASGVEAAVRAGLEVIRISSANDVPRNTGAVVQANWSDMLAASRELGA